VARQSGLRRDDTSLGECQRNVVGKDMVGLGGKFLGIQCPSASSSDSDSTLCVYLSGIHGHAGHHRRRTISIQDWYLEDAASGRLSKEGSRVKLILLNISRGLKHYSLPRMQK
jgi:hypothetical protein